MVRFVASHASTSIVPGSERRRLLYPLLITSLGSCRTPLSCRRTSTSPSAPNVLLGHPFTVREHRCSRMTSNFSRTFLPPKTKIPRTDHTDETAGYWDTSHDNRIWQDLMITLASPSAYLNKFFWSLIHLLLHRKISTWRISSVDHTARYFFNSA